MQPSDTRIRNPLIEPGTYICGLPGIHGWLLYLYRCQHCWYDWLGIPHRQPQTAYNEPAEIQCPQCGRFGKYVCADADVYTSKKVSSTVSVIRRRRITPDTSVPGSLFDGVSDDAGTGEGIGQGKRERENLRG